MNAIIANLQNVQAAATTISTPDGALTVNIVLSLPDVEAGRQVQIGNMQHRLEPDTARAAVSAPPSEAEMALGMSLFDLVTVRALMALHAAGQLAVPQLIPEALKA